MSYPFHISMNDADRSVSPDERRQSVGNSTKIAQTAERVQVLERDDDFALDRMWPSFIRQASQDVEDFSKPLTNPQISLYRCYYGTLISHAESGEGTAASGQATQVLDYLPYGGTRVDTGTDTSQREYIGQFFDETTQMSYLNARYLQNTRGQFLSQDPVFWELGRTRDGKVALYDPQLQNSYSYARNNPITLKDADGRFVPVLILGALAFYGGYSAGTDLYQGYTSGDSGQFAVGVIGAVTSVIPGGGAAKGAAALTDDVAKAGFKSFDAFKRAMGAAGEGKEWHHLVEQTINKDRFSAEILHSKDNVVSIASDLHRKISGFYSSKLDFTGGQTVRQWISTKSFQQQLDFAKKQLERAQKELDKIKNTKPKK